MKIKDIYHKRGNYTVSIVIAILCVVVTLISLFIPSTYQAIAYTYPIEYPWQVCTGIFLHGAPNSPIKEIIGHLIFNLLLVIPFGIMLEKILGSKRFALMSLVLWIVNANRIDYSEVDEDENPYSQLPDVYKALDYLGIKYLETTTCETDDIIAGYVLKYGTDYEMVISSFDSDFFQLITEKVSVLRYRGEKTVMCTPAYMKEKFDISPAQYADFKSLVGDHADNIKGVNKVGPKTAAMLLKEYGTVYGLLDHADKISRPALRDSILENIERVKKNYKLIKLLPRDELPVDLQDLRFEDQGMKTNEVLKGIGLK